ncbi:protein of unknown function [Candidatus Filomicrobium marinum]|uniref:Uncharacterized protein n=1 Tax=Candidatus Filomicrobium marinum TaxID=1608628 RepID=A0A0D6JAC9_9HYPH|nr:protein of unknown function [Candidatus Filomicrobium marinum]CPR15552.1 protein of unknown function [Candidatus Filomicrobium marinum]
MSQPKHADEPLHLISSLSLIRDNKITHQIVTARTMRPNKICGPSTRFSNLTQVPT